MPTPSHRCLKPIKTACLKLSVYTAHWVLWWPLASSTWLKGALALCPLKCQNWIILNYISHLCNLRILFTHQNNNYIASLYEAILVLLQASKHPNIPETPCKCSLMSPPLAQLFGLGYLYTQWTKIESIFKRKGFKFNCNSCMPLPRTDGRLPGNAKGGRER